MTIGNTTAHFAAVAVAAALLSHVAPVMAQQAGKTVPPPKVQGVTAGAVKKPAKPIQRSAASQNSRATPAQSREWTLEDALPERSVIMRQYEPVRAPDVGRVPLRSGPGSFGLTTDTQVNPNRLPDGRPIPQPGIQCAAKFVLCGHVAVGADQRQGDEHPAAVCCPTVTTGG